MLPDELTRAITDGEFRLWLEAGKVRFSGKRSVVNRLLPILKKYRAEIESFLKKAHISPVERTNSPGDTKPSPYPKEGQNGAENGQVDLTCKRSDPLKVRIIAIRSSGPKGPITWPREDTRAVERAVNKPGGLSEAINTVAFHRGQVAWLVQCPALGKNPVWLYYEKDEVLSKPEKATGYVIYSDGTFERAEIKNDEGDCGHERSQSSNDL